MRPFEAFQYGAAPAADGITLQLAVAAEAGTPILPAPLSQPIFSDAQVIKEGKFFGHHCSEDILSMFRADMRTA